MNRRGFLRSVAAAAASGLILPEIARELMLPKRTIFLPPTDGWFSIEVMVREVIGYDINRDELFIAHKMIGDAGAMIDVRQQPYSTHIPLDQYRDYASRKMREVYSRSALMLMRAAPMPKGWEYLATGSNGLDMKHVYIPIYP